MSKFTLKLHLAARRSQGLAWSSDSTAGATAAVMALLVALGRDGV